MPRATADRPASSQRAPFVEPYDHDELVREVAEFLSTGHYGLVHACAGPYSPPAPVADDAAREAFTPDVTATPPSGRVDLFAVETPASLRWPSTARAWRAFAKAARAGGAFWIVVRRPLRGAVIRRLAELHLRARVLAL